MPDLGSGFLNFLYEPDFPEQDSENLDSGLPDPENPGPFRVLTLINIFPPFVCI